MPNIPQQMQGQLIFSHPCIGFLVLFRTISSMIYYGHFSNRLNPDDIPSIRPLNKSGFASTKSSNFIPLAISFILHGIELFSLTRLLQYLQIITIQGAVQCAFWLWVGFKCTTGYHRVYTLYKFQQSLLSLGKDLLFDLFLLIVSAVVLTVFGY